MYWQDERLAYFNTGYKKRLALNAKMVQHMWIPDIYFVNEKSGIKHDLTKENEVVRLWPDGRVFHSMRYVKTKSAVSGFNSAFSSGGGRFSQEKWMRLCELLTLCKTKIYLRRRPKFRYSI